MPSYRGHILGGVMTFGFVAISLPSRFMPFGMNLFTLANSLFICVLGALFPDIDTRSVGRRYFYYALAAGLGVAAIQHSYPLLIFFLMLGIFPFLIPHRGLTHNPLFLIVSPVVLLHIAFPEAPWLASIKLHYYIFFVAGALSHVLLDFAPYYLFNSRASRRRKQR